MGFTNVAPTNSVTERKTPMPRRKKDYKPDETIEVDIRCPCCGMVVHHSYRAEHYSPVFGQCVFCNAKFKWSRSKTIEVIDRNRISYIVNIPKDTAKDTLTQSI